MTTARNRDPIRKITTKTGETRYRFIIDMGKRPDGKRDQRCFTYPSLREARAERAKIISDRSRGTLVKRTKVTVAEAITAWLDGRRNLRPSTQRNYADSLKLVSDRLGHIQLQTLTKAQLDDLVTDLLHHGRRVGNVQRHGLSPRSINLALTLLGSVLDDAVRQGTLSRDVAKMVERVRQDKHEMKTWTEGHATAFLEAVADDRLSAAWQLSLYGLRRGEVLGLCWSDVDLHDKMITIRRARVEITGVGVVEGEPKTERGKRTLPLDDGLVAALRTLKTRQARERLEAGEAYSPGCGDCSGAHVVVDELGEPYRPEWYSDQFRQSRASSSRARDPWNSRAAFRLGFRRRDLRLRGPRARSAGAGRSPGPPWPTMGAPGHFPVYQVLLRGPTKIEYLFLSRSQDPQPPLEPSRDTLPAINTHFWDWIWWLTTKASIGRTDLVAEHLPQLYTQLLQPMGISAVPATIESAVEAFVARRNALEQKFGISVDRALENEVRQGIARVLDPPIGGVRYGMTARPRLGSHGGPHGIAHYEPEAGRPKKCSARVARTVDMSGRP